MSAYLTDYKSQTDPKIRDDYSRKFTCYLLSTCWRKILRRIKSWQATGFIHFLNLIPLSSIKDGRKWDRFPSCIETGDKTLKDFLGHAQSAKYEVPAIHSLLFAYIPHPYLPDVKQFLSVRCSKSSSEPLFSMETIAGFHGLVVGAFKGFAYTFLQIRDKYVKLVSMDYQALEM